MTVLLKGKDCDVAKTIFNQLFVSLANIVCMHFSKVSNTVKMWTHLSLNVVVQAFFNRTPKTATNEIIKSKCSL